MKDLAGQRFGKLTVIDFAELNKRNYLWNCVCDCGKRLKVNAYNLTKNNGQKSCIGCANKTRAITHGHSIAGLKTRTYAVWSQMLHRCRSRSQKFAYTYGHVSVCERWHKYENFLADMGEQPPGLQIDRIDNDGNYEPNNCRWATRAQQLANRRTYRPRDTQGHRTKLTADMVRQIRERFARGETQVALGAEFGVTGSNICQIIKRYSWRHI